jgi:hypothetical protein
VPPWLASWVPPFGELVGGDRGGILLLLRFAASVTFVLFSALRLSGQVPASGELPFASFLSLQASLWLGSAAALLLALSGLLAEGKRRLGAVLLGLAVFGQPLVFVFEALPGDGFYLSGATVLLLGWPSGGINLPEAILFALLALLLLRATQKRLGRLWEGTARENGEKTRRLYEDASPRAG